MKHKPRMVAAALFAFVLWAAPSLWAQSRAGKTQTARPALTGSHKSYTRARAILDAGVDALGGLDAFRAANDISLEAHGTSYARNQSLRAVPPFDPMSRDEKLYADVRNRRFIFENRDPLPGGFVFGGKTVINGANGFFVDPINQTIGPLNLTNFNNINLVRRVPHLLLSLALERAATLRFLGTEMYAGRSHHVITFATAFGNQITLFFDARNKLLTKYEQMVTDNVAGDALQETIFPGYAQVGALKVATGRATLRAGDLIEDVKYSNVQLNTRLPDSAFAKPEGFREVPAPAPAPIKETKLGEGVYLFESGYSSLVVVFKDYVLVVEPGAGGRGPEPTINKIKEMFPNRPIRYIVPTHHHDDHSGGARSYIAEGAAIVTTPANRGFFEQMARASLTITPDRQTERPRPPVFEFIQGGRRTFTDGSQTVEIIDIGPSPHAQEMLIAYVPQEKLVFQGDLVNLPQDGKYVVSTVNDTTLHFYDALRRLGIEAKRIAAVHGPMTTWDDLREAVEKKRGR